MKEIKPISFTIPPKPPEIKLMGYQLSSKNPRKKGAPSPLGEAPQRQGISSENIYGDFLVGDYLGRVSLKAPHTQFSVIPSRAISDPRINTRKPLLLLLGAIGVHVSAKGICYPSQHRLAMLCGKSRSWAGKYMKELLALGYIRRLVPPTPKGKRTAWRIQVLWRGNDPLPGKESDWLKAPWCWQT